MDELQREDLRFLENKLNGLRHYFRQSSQDLLKSLRQAQAQPLAMVPMGVAAMPESWGENAHLD